LQRALARAIIASFTAAIIAKRILFGGERGGRMVGTEGSQKVSIFLAPAICGAMFLAFSIQYANVTPLFEAPDEPAHLEYIRYLRVEKRLPIYDTTIRFRYQSKHPPLYYGMLAFVFDPLSIQEHFPERTGAPHPLLYPHPSDEPQRWRGVFELRLLQLSFGLATVLLTFAIALRVSGDRVCAAFACWFVAMLPQFQYGSATLSNDNLANTFGALCLLYSVWTLSHAEPSGWEGALAGVLSGLALLAKLSTLWAAPLYLLTLLLRRVSWRRRLTVAGICGGATLLVASPFYVWFWQTTGSLFPRLPNPDPMGLSGDRLALFWKQTAFSFIGKFGWMTYEVPRGVYYTLFAVLILAVLGWGLRIRGPAASVAMRRGLILCVAAFGAAFGLYILFNVFQDFAPMSRYWFTTLPAFAVLVSIGIERCIRVLPGLRARSLAWAASFAILLATSAISLTQWAEFAG